MRNTSAIALIKATSDATELFGPRSTDADTRAQRRFHELARAVHPDRVDTPGASAAFAKLVQLYQDWQTPSALVGAHGRYLLGARYAVGSVATIYRTDRDAVAKIARRPTANRLLRNERTTLTDIARMTDEYDWLRPYFPELRDTVDLVDPASGTPRTANILGALTDGFVSLDQVRLAHPDGVDPRDYAWMHRRLLRCLAGAARTGWVHTAITPANVLIHPQAHGVVLVGWSFATRPGLPACARIPAARYPDEIGTAVVPETDVWMAHQLLLTMLGPAIPGPMRTFAACCMHDSAPMRPDAATLLDEFDDLLGRLYGKRRFRPFEMPLSKD